MVYSSDTYEVKDINMTAIVTKRWQCIPLLLIGFFLSSGVFAQTNAPQKAVATLFGNPVSASDIEPNKAAKKKAKDVFAQQYQSAVENMRQQNLASKIIDRVIEEYQKKNNITVNRELVEDFKRVFKASLDEQNTTAAKRQEIGVKQVLQWQTDKALYEEFGGTVIFQQTNPQFPVEAYHQLLKQYANAGAFTFKHNDDEAAFWQPFEPPFTLIIEPEDINFAKPWWQP